MTTRCLLVSLFFSVTSLACDDATCPSGKARQDGACTGSNVDAGHICYLDQDHDGIGAGEEVDCDDDVRFAAAGEGAVAPLLSDRNDDCDDQDPRRAPTLEERCDGVDNNCNGGVDEGALNACGGACGTVTADLGTPCTTGLEGACGGPAAYACSSDRTVVCRALTSSAEVCGDGLDNDCNGRTDEPEAVDATVWYRDCDGDGYAASTEGSLRACQKPEDTEDGCTWTHIFPQLVTKSNWDCDDRSPEYSPAADYGVPSDVAGSWDLNCDGHANADPEFRFGVAPKTPYGKCDSYVKAWANNPQFGECTAAKIGPTNEHYCVLWMTPEGRYDNLEATFRMRCPSNIFKVFFDSTKGDCRIRAGLLDWPCR